MRKLHIGGETPMPGWEILNIRPGPHVDHVGDARDLSAFSDGTFAEIYASHVLEHLDYSGEIDRVLAEWKRALVPGGTLSISVPDMYVLSSLFSGGVGMTPQDRYDTMRMMFGGHTHEFDYHKSGLYEELLAFYLHSAGFGEIRRHEQFSVFPDTSGKRFKGVLISLNMTASKPAGG